MKLDFYKFPVDLSALLNKKRPVDSVGVAIIRNGLSVSQERLLEKLGVYGELTVVMVGLCRHGLWLTENETKRKFSEAYTKELEFLCGFISIAEYFPLEHGWVNTNRGVYFVINTPDGILGFRSMNMMAGRLYRGEITDQFDNVAIVAKMLNRLLS